MLLQPLVTYAAALLQQQQQKLQLEPSSSITGRLSRGVLLLGALQRRAGSSCSRSGAARDERTAAGALRLIRGLLQAPSIKMEEALPATSIAAALQQQVAAEKGTRLTLPQRLLRGLLAVPAAAAVSLGSWGAPSKLFQTISRGTKSITSMSSNSSKTACVCE